MRHHIWRRSKVIEKEAHGSWLETEPEPRAQVGTGLKAHFFLEAMKKIEKKA